MRSEKEMYDLIVGVAREDERIRAVMMNGSRANPNAPADIFQDFDIVYFVSELDSFKADPHWIDCFGERMMMQLPDDMEDPPPPDDPVSYGHMTLADSTASVPVSMIVIICIVVVSPVIWCRTLISD